MAQWTSKQLFLNHFSSSTRFFPELLNSFIAGKWCNEIKIGYKHRVQSIRTLVCQSFFSLLCHVSANDGGLRLTRTLKTVTAEHTDEIRLFIWSWIWSEKLITIYCYYLCTYLLFLKKTPETDKTLNKFLAYKSSIVIIHRCWVKIRNFLTVIIHVRSFSYLVRIVTIPADMIKKLNNLSSLIIQTGITLSKHTFHLLNVIIIY